jgi:hypothetical protein
MSVESAAMTRPPVAADSFSPAMCAGMPERYVSATCAGAEGSVPISNTRTFPCGVECSTV